MARAMWKGAIQFGLVTIPVKLYLATESSSIGFNLLHAKDLSRIQMKIYCPEDDEVIPRSETVRGYEWAKGRYVVLDDKDFEAASKYLGSRGAERSGSTSNASTAWRGASTTRASRASRRCRPSCRRGGARTAGPLASASFGRRHDSHQPA